MTRFSSVGVSKRDTRQVSHSFAGRVGNLGDIIDRFPLPHHAVTFLPLVAYVFFAFAFGFVGLYGLLLGVASVVASQQLSLVMVKRNPTGETAFPLQQQAAQPRWSPPIRSFEDEPVALEVRGSAEQPASALAADEEIATSTEGISVTVPEAYLDDPGNWDNPDARNEESTRIRTPAVTSTSSSSLDVSTVAQTQAGLVDPSPGPRIAIAPQVDDVDTASATAVVVRREQAAPADMLQGDPATSEPPQGHHDASEPLQDDRLTSEQVHRDRAGTLPPQGDNVMTSMGDTTPVLVLSSAAVGAAPRHAPLVVTHARRAPESQAPAPAAVAAAVVGAGAEAEALPDHRVAAASAAGADSAALHTAVPAAPLAAPSAATTEPRAPSLEPSLEPAHAVLSPVFERVIEMLANTPRARSLFATIDCDKDARVTLRDIVVHHRSVSRDFNNYDLQTSLRSLTTDLATIGEDRDPDEKLTYEQFEQLIDAIKRNNHPLNVIAPELERAPTVEEHRANTPLPDIFRCASPRVAFVSFSAPPMPVPSSDLPTAFPSKVLDPNDNEDSDSSDDECEPPPPSVAADVESAYSNLPGELSVEIPELLSSGIIVRGVEELRLSRWAAGTAQIPRSFFMCASSRHVVWARYEPDARAVQLLDPSCNFQLAPASKTSPRNAKLSKARIKNVHAILLMNTSVCSSSQNFTLTEQHALAATPSADDAVALTSYHFETETAEECSAWVDELSQFLGKEKARRSLSLAAPWAIDNQGMNSNSAPPKDKESCRMCKRSCSVKSCNIS